MQEITLADHADYVVVLVDDRNRTDAALSQQSRYSGYSRVLVDRDNFARHDIDRMHRIAPDYLGKQQNTALPAACTGPDQLTRAVDGSLFSPRSRNVSLIHIKAAVLGPDSFEDHERITLSQGPGIYRRSARRFEPATKRPFLLGNARRST
jgi:hypothetical protein